MALLGLVPLGTGCGLHRSASNSSNSAATGDRIKRVGYNTQVLFCLPALVVFYILFFREPNSIYKV